MGWREKKRSGGRDYDTDRISFFSFSSSMGGKGMQWGEVGMQIRKEEEGKPCLRTCAIKIAPRDFFLSLGLEGRISGTDLFLPIPRRCEM